MKPTIKVESPTIHLHRDIFGRFLCLVNPEDLSDQDSDLRNSEFLYF